MSVRFGIPCLPASCGSSQLIPNVCFFARSHPCMRIQINVSVKCRVKSQDAIPDVSDAELCHSFDIAILTFVIAPVCVKLRAGVSGSIKPSFPSASDCAVF